MKELDPPHQDNTHDERKAHADKKLGQRHIPTGVKVWQVDPNTEQPVEVVVKMARKVEKVLGGELTIEQTHLKVEKSPDLFYCMAINPKNALRKYFKSQFYAKIRHNSHAAIHPS